MEFPNIKSVEIKYDFAGGVFYDCAMNVRTSKI